MNYQLSAPLLNARQAGQLTGVRAAILLKLALLGKLPYRLDERTHLVLFDRKDLIEWRARA